MAKKKRQHLAASVVQNYIGKAVTSHLPAESTAIQRPCIVATSVTQGLCGFWSFLGKCFCTETRFSLMMVAERERSRFVTGRSARRGTDNETIFVYTGGRLRRTESVKIQFCKSMSPRASCSQINWKNLCMLHFLRTCLVKTRLSTTLSNSASKPWLHLRDQDWVTMTETGRAPAPICIEFDQGWVKDNWKCPLDRGITEHAAGKWDLVREIHTHTRTQTYAQKERMVMWGGAIIWCLRN